MPFETTFGKMDNIIYFDLKFVFMIMKRTSISIRIVFNLLSSILFLFSCTKTENIINNSNDSNIHKVAGRTGNDISYVEGSNTILGERKKNPYTVENMTTAWHNLANQGISTHSNASVYVSHFYVKFSPRNSEEYEILHDDTTLAFSDYPIESEIVQNGDYYHDPSLDDSIPTYQYTAVPIDYKFPEGIEYEILDNLYIPESDPIFQYENGGDEDCFVDKLLNEVYSITGNDEDIIDLSDCNDNSPQRCYIPGGKLRIFDTRLSEWIGMEGVRVQARRWFTFRNAFSDFNGDYRMKKCFKRPCNYSIWFARDRFAVRHNVVNTTFWINGPKIRGDWNYDLNNSYQRFAGHVFRGAFRYQYKEIGGLVRPNRWLGRRSIYVAVDGFSHNIGTAGVNWTTFPVIKI